MQNVSKAIALRLKQLLKERGITMYRLEQNMGLSHETLKSIVKGKTRGVNLKTVIVIAEGLSMTVSEFLDSELFNYSNLNLE